MKILETLQHHARTLKHRLQGKIPGGSKRSPRWSALEKQVLLEQPFCEGCGTNKNLEVHHVIPFHVDPAKELIRSNLKVLCESKKNGLNCHLFLGHRGSFFSWNVFVHGDSKQAKERILERPTLQSRKKSP